MPLMPLQTRLTPASQVISCYGDHQENQPMLTLLQSPNIDKNAYRQKSTPTRSINKLPLRNANQNDTNSSFAPTQYVATAFEKYVITKLESIQMQIKNIQKTLDFMQKNVSLPNNDKINIPFKLPINNVEYFIELDKSLSLRNLFDDMVINHLKKVGGNSSSDCCRRVTKRNDR